MLSLPVTLSPTGRGDDVRFGGYESTVLFTQTEDSPADVDLSLDGSAGTLDVTMRVVPARCDPHALAEDKVGTLFGIVVRSADLPDGATFHLPLQDQTRAALRAFYQSACGFS